jgi:hypothetical protein
MADTLENSFTETELTIIRAAAASGCIRAIDARSDGFPDCDALSDARRVGERIADGFAIINASIE